MHQENFKQDMICYTLSKSVFGSELKSSDLEALASVCSLRTVAKDAYLFHQGDTAKCFFIVHSGSIKVHRVMPDGREQVIHIFRNGESFAEIALSGIPVYPISAAALEESQVICVESARLGSLLIRIPELSLRIIASMSLHLKFLVGKLEKQNFQQADGRLASWILERCDGQEGSSFELKTKKKNIASQLGITSETLSRTLNQFKSSEWISEANKTWTVLKPEALKACSESYNPEYQL